MEEGKKIVPVFRVWPTEYVDTTRKLRPNETPLDQLVHGRIYELQSRNLNCGVWSKERQGFIGIREKFGSRYLDTELHWDTDSHHGTATGHREMGKVPETILITEFLGSKCVVCERGIKFIKDEPQSATNSKGHWECESECETPQPTLIPNPNLFMLLQPHDNEVKADRRARYDALAAAHAAEALLEKQKQEHPTSNPL